MQLKPSRTPLAGRGCFGRSFAHVDLPMAVDMEQLQVVRRVPTTSAAPDAMMDLTVLLCQAQWLTADPTSSLFVSSRDTRSACCLSASGPVAKSTVLPGTVPTADRRDSRRFGSSHNG